MNLAPFKELLKNVSEEQLAYVCKFTKISETAEYKAYAKGQSKNAVNRNFLLSMFDNNRSVVAKIYKKIEPLLFVGGCFPGVGIAFNVVDAIFCVILQQYLAAFIAIASCFPLPGLKAIGKILGKILGHLIELLSRVFKMIPTDKIIAFVGKRLLDMKIDPPTGLKKMVENLRECIKELHNEALNRLADDMSKSVDKVYPQHANGTIQNPFGQGLEIERKGIDNIGKGWGMNPQTTIDPFGSLTLTMRGRL